jgi:hypothetical protein
MPNSRRKLRRINSNPSRCVMSDEPFRRDVRMRMPQLAEREAGNVTRLSITLPAAGNSPSEFRRNVLRRLREATSDLLYAGEISGEIAEEILRALPHEQQRQ